MEEETCLHLSRDTEALQFGLDFILAMECQDTSGVARMRSAIDGIADECGRSFHLRGDVGPAGGGEEVLDLVGGTEGRAQFADRLAEGGMPPCPGDLRERDEDEGAFGQTRMRHVEIGFV